MIDEPMETTDPPTDPSLDKTIIVSSSGLTRRKIEATYSAGSETIFPDQTITLMIRTLREAVTLSNDQSVVLGRSDVQTGFYPEIDLSPYGAKERGISREHARLHLHEGRLYVIDLGSANGTYVDGQRIDSDTPILLRSDSEILLSHLPVKVIYATDDRPDSLPD